MKDSNRMPDKLLLKSIALLFAAIILFSPITVFDFRNTDNEQKPEIMSNQDQTFTSTSFEGKTVITEEGTWESFDSADPGTPAEAHVTIADTSGLTVVVDFHGFWRQDVTIDEDSYYNLMMPGVNSIRVPGQPMLPRLTEYFEVPHGAMISVDMLAASTGVLSNYNVTPAPRHEVTLGSLEKRNTTPTSSSQTVFDDVYSQNAFFPAEPVSIEGGSNTTPMVMRGHRVVSMFFYPVQFNPDNGTCITYSQMTIKIKYQEPAQILPISDSLWSESYELILRELLLYYDGCHTTYRPQPGLPTLYSPTIPGTGQRAEYLIITTQEYADQARRLAHWKQRKGVPSAVEVVPAGAGIEFMQNVIGHIYNTWSLVPTFVLLFGDADDIHPNYDFVHEAVSNVEDPITGEDIPYFDQQYGYIASDLGYFTLDGYDYYPDMIYSRISVDNEVQAQIIVDKILYYEAAPPVAPTYFNGILNLAYFEDKDKEDILDGIEQSEFPFVYFEERARDHLEGNLGYDVYYNYSALYDPDWDPPAGHIPEEFHAELFGSRSVYDTIPSNYEWLIGYHDIASDFEVQKDAVLANLNEGRFLVCYYGHGNSKNFIYPYDMVAPSGHDHEDRQIFEGFTSPYFNVTNIPELTNGNMTPLIISLGCNTGWFDGETDQQYMDQPLLSPNPYASYASESFAEEIMRKYNGGALAIIAPSRLAYSLISGDLQDGILQAFWPSFRSGQTHPIYEMGAALLYGKLYAAKIWQDNPPVERDEDLVRTTFETYHLFGDPETPLWTDMPTRFDVSYPRSVGTESQQKFVVTVRNETSLEPVSFAKVCIQQQPGIYQVGYTNTRGQVIFNITPSQSISHVNVTVTKHNFKPHIGWMAVHVSDSKIRLENYYGVENEQIIFYRNGFAEGETVWIYMNETKVATLNSDATWTAGLVPQGKTNYINVWAAVNDSMAPYRMWEPVSVDRFARISENEGPDLYLYSQNDPWTWSVTGGIRVWDNPDIVIKRGGVEVSSTIRHVPHEVEVTVYNKGSEDADQTTITLSYARIGGGMTFTPVRTMEDILVEVGVPKTVSFTFTPELPGQACIMVQVSEYDEWPFNEINNIGMENVGVVEMSSPGSEDFQVVNPEAADYVLIKVKQISDIANLWNATVSGHSNQTMDTNETELASIHVDPGYEIDEDEYQVYEVLIIRNCRVIGGMILNASIPPPVDKVCIFGVCIEPELAMAIGGAVILIIIVAVIYYKKR